MQKGSEETGEFSLLKLLFIPLLPEEKEAYFSPSQPACAFPKRNGLSVAHLNLPEKLCGLKRSTSHKQSLNSAAKGTPVALELCCSSNQ